MQSADLFIQNAKQLIHFDRVNQESKDPCWRMSILENGYVAISDSKILAIGDKLGEILLLKLHFKHKTIFKK